ncbi:hypothetical protein [Enorma burkinafasonensis]|uniref:hypothetical protein n=1 Tax=Enorma burkinafasonensis TaxID=2590867 RepID=UPI0011A5E8C0|nr:hypothetical protein [Enorma burkinafasonensis]
MEGTNNTINPADKKAPVMLIARIALAVAAALLVAAFFLPWASADEEFREGAAALPDFMFYEPADMTVADACDISLLEYAQVYGSMEGTAWVVYMVVMYAGLALSVVALLLAVLGKPIGTAVFAVLACAVSRLLVWDFGDRGVPPAPRTTGARRLRSTSLPPSRSSRSRSGSSYSGVKRRPLGEDRRMRRAGHSSVCGSQRM